MENYDRFSLKFADEAAARAALFDEDGERRYPSLQMAGFPTPTSVPTGEADEYGNRLMGPAEGFYVACTSVGPLPEELEEFSVGSVPGFEWAGK